jgi:CheY-like chemotaxis protein
MDRGYVLVVDDDPGIHNLIGLILRRLSLNVKYALNGYEALDMVAAHRPNLLLLDLDMPGLDGFGVLTHLSQNEDTADIPVMIYSAHASVTQRQGYEWPPQVVNVLEKSQVRPAELRDSVRDQLLLRKDATA